MQLGSNAIVTDRQSSLNTSLINCHIIASKGDTFMEKKSKVLFVCVHNSARSQMAEAFLNHLAGDRFEAQSAGLEPGTLNPLAVETMAEAGIDISGNQTKGVFDFFKSGAMFNYVVTVCDGANAERCPIFPGVTQRLHWSFADPSALEGTHEEKLAAVRRIRDEIKASVELFVEQTVG
jgi:arsenate reductase